MRHVRPLLVAGLVLVTARAAEAQKSRLGSLDFPNSGAPEAQADFIQGVLLLHSFEYQDAAEAFRRAQEADPDFALAYWGEAMTYNHPIWAEQDPEAGRAALDRYDGTPSTGREILYLAAVRQLYGEGSKGERDRRYMLAMRRLHQAHPDDDEARAFYALSILGLTNGVRDFANYMRGAAVAQPVFLRNPDHPGAAHYLIHAFDDPIHAPLGLPAARAYGASTPDAGHAQHMTSHIFLAMGMWDDVIRANINATRVADADRARRRGQAMPNRCGHYPYWLHYGYLMTEQWDEATGIMELCQANLADPDRDDPGYYVSTRARQIIDSRSWDATGRWRAELPSAPRLQAAVAFVDGYAALHRGDLEGGRAALAELQAISEDQPRLEIMRLELSGLISVAEGDADAGLNALRSAAEIESSLPLEFGPPASLMPPHELLGETLLELGEGEEAVEAFRESLALTPRRMPSLRGLAAAARMAGMEELARDTEAEIAEILSGV